MTTLVIYYAGYGTLKEERFRTRSEVIPRIAELVSDAKTDRTWLVDRVRYAYTDKKENLPSSRKLSHVEVTLR